MASRRRIPRLIANPVTTVVLAAALLADLYHLPGDPWAPVHSTAGVFFQSLFERKAPSQPPGRGTDAIIFKEPRGLRLANMRTEPSWGDIATIMSDKPAEAALFTGPQHYWTGRGFWAITTLERRLDIDAQFGTAFSGADEDLARELFINEMVSPEWDESPRLLERLRREDFTVTEVVWGGVLHNVLALAGGVLLVMSLAWVPRTPGFLRERRARRRLRRGLCPRCAYSIAGLAPGAVCPECGAGVAGSVGAGGPGASQT